jgi:hypothetical protein
LSVAKPMTKMGLHNRVTPPDKQRTASATLPGPILTIRLRLSAHSSIPENPPWIRITLACRPDRALPRPAAGIGLLRKGQTGRAPAGFAEIPAWMVAAPEGALVCATVARQTSNSQENLHHRHETAGFSRVMIR